MAPRAEERRYVGAVGSSRTSAERRRLADFELTAQQSRLRPVKGLSIGSHPARIALAISPTSASC
jgi:xanthine/CO dehydrogenase XdhC/CoxF family maturation factor